jgi:hypothetical protein
MQPLIIDPAQPFFDPDNLIGAIVTHQVRVPGGGRIRKGQVIAREDLEAIARLDRPIHAVRLDPGEVHEDDAGVRLAAMAMGPGLAARNPVQSRVNIIATTKGLLRVDAEAVLAINRQAPAGLFTVLDRLPVVPGKIVAGAKIATVAIDGTILDQIAALVADRGRPVLEVKPYLPHCVGVVVTEGLTDKVRDRFEAAVRAKVAWYDSQVLRFDYVANEPGVVIGALERQRADGATMLLQPAAT